MSSGFPCIDCGPPPPEFHLSPPPIPPNVRLLFDYRSCDNNVLLNLAGLIQINSSWNDKSNVQVSEVDVAAVGSSSAQNILTPTLTIVLICCGALVLAVISTLIVLFACRRKQDRCKPVINFKKNVFFRRSSASPSPTPSARCKGTVHIRRDNSLATKHLFLEPPTAVCLHDAKLEENNPALLDLFNSATSQNSSGSNHSNVTVSTSLFNGGVHSPLEATPTENIYEEIDSRPASKLNFETFFPLGHHNRKYRAESDTSSDGPIGGFPVGAFQRSPGDSGSSAAAQPCARPPSTSSSSGGSGRHLVSTSKVRMGLNSLQHPSRQARHPPTPQSPIALPTTEERAPSKRRSRRRQSTEGKNLSMQRHPRAESVPSLRGRKTAVPCSPAAERMQHPYHVVDICRPSYVTAPQPYELDGLTYYPSLRPDDSIPDIVVVHPDRRSTHTLQQHRLPHTDFIRFVSGLSGTGEDFC